MSDVMGLKRCCSQGMNMSAVFSYICTDMPIYEMARQAGFVMLESFCFCH